MRENKGNLKDYEEVRRALFVDTKRRPQRRLIRMVHTLVNGIMFALALLLALYAGYSLWYNYSLTHGAFLSDELAAFKPNGQDPTLADLMALNNDVCAWITFEDTSIDYPVVQGQDDVEYLNKNVAGEFSLAGAIFLSNTNTRDFSDAYNIVYGHHVAGGAMFSDILKFREKAFFEEHPQGILWLADAAYRIEVFACVEIDGLDKIVYQDPHEVMPQDISELAAYANEHAVQSRSKEFFEADHLVALSTCEDASSFNRVVLMGKLVAMTDDEIEEAEKKNLKEQALIEKDTTVFDKTKEFIALHPFAAYGSLLVVLVVLLLIAKRIFADKSRHS